MDKRRKGGSSTLRNRLHALCMSRKAWKRISAVTIPLCLVRYESKAKRTPYVSVEQVFHSHLSDGAINLSLPH
jgi:hypothetical protein